MTSLVGVHLALRNQLLTMDGLPDLVAHENKSVKRAVGALYVRESLVPGTASHSGFAAVGYIKSTGFYVLQWNGLADTGLAIAAAADAVLDLFPPGLGLAAHDGTVVRIEQNPAPYRGQVTAADPGWAVCTIKIPWYCYTASALPAFVAS